MSKYKFADSKAPAPKRHEVPAIMRGIGCIMIVIVPILSYIASTLLVENGFARQVIPPAWFGRMEFPPLLAQLRGPLGDAIRYLSRVNHLAANLVLTIVIVVIVGGLMTMIYGYIYELFGPPKYGPTDAPPPRGIKVKRYKR